MKGDAKVHVLIVMDAGKRRQQVSSWFVIIVKSRGFSGRFGFFSGVFPVLSLPGFFRVLECIPLPTDTSSKQVGLNWFASQKNSKIPF